MSAKPTGGESESKKTKKKGIHMAKIIPLFSGSKGNAFFVGSGGQGVLIDAGRSCRQIEQAMTTNNMSMSAIKGIFITHEHTDHCKGLRVLTNRYKLPVFASGGTLRALELADCLDTNTQTTIIENSVALGDMQITRINTSHDTEESCCYSITLSDGRKAVVATDLGVMSPALRQEISSANLVLLESNHDVNMLRNGWYPYSLKRRILSDKGHLSNDSCAAELADFIKSGCNRVILGHLSQENNTPELAAATSLCQLQTQGMQQDIDFTLDVAPANLSQFSVVF
ncbi:MAG: MBL fold metallo-hydrolase [Oscillospiraceae bacterium]|jgi:phosphoribosyl 1,2-cyclic phosphodiesterase|nr:MBL fold metallo-hydrolase [Oscillospiraceae bacterium]